MIDAFKRASKSILAVLGQDAFLRDDPVPHKINIEHGVQVVAEDQLVTERSVATIPADLLPVTGDKLVHPDGEYLLDGIYQDNGVNKRFVLKSTRWHVS